MQGVILYNSVHEQHDLVKMQPLCVPKNSVVTVRLMLLSLHYASYIMDTPRKTQDASLRSQLATAGREASRTVSASEGPRMFF